MNRPPEPPPEGVLIETARNEARLSVREAARRAGISEGWWRQVVKGYQSLSGGTYGDVRAPADTVAGMAKVAGVTPEQLESEGQRPDAAEILRKMDDDDGDVANLLEASARLGIPVRARFDHIMRTYRKVRDVFPRGEWPPGVLLFEDSRYADLWDSKIGQTYADGQDYSPSRIAFVVAMQQVRDEAEREKRGNTATGLAGR